MPRVQRERLARLGYHHTIALPPSPVTVQSVAAETPLPPSPIDSEPSRGRSLTRALATGSRSGALPLVEPDPRIRPRRGQSLRADTLEHSLNGIRCRGYHVRLEVAVIKKKVHLAMAAANDAADVAAADYMKAQKNGASTVLADLGAARQLAANQIFWASTEREVVWDEIPLLLFKPVPAGQFDRVFWHRRQENLEFIKELRAAAAVARAPFDNA